MSCKHVKKACFIASSGGHWEELMCLKELADSYDTFFVTEEGGQAKDSNLENFKNICVLVLRCRKNAVILCVAGLKTDQNDRN